MDLGFTGVASLCWTCSGVLCASWGSPLVLFAVKIYRDWGDPCLLSQACCNHLWGRLGPATCGCPVSLLCDLEELLLLPGPIRPPTVFPLCDCLGGHFSQSTSVEGLALVT